MILMAIVAYTAGALNQSLYAEGFGVINFIEEPGLALVQALMLRFQPALTGKFPSARIKIVSAVERQTAKHAIERLDRDVLLLKPTLIIWETTKAVHGTDVEEFRGTMQAGIDKLRASG